MRPRSTNLWLVTAVVIMGGAWAFGLLRAQEATPQPVTVVPAPQPVVPRTQPVHSSWSEDSVPHAHFPFGAQGFGTNVAASIRKAAEAVRDAQGDEAKAAAEKTLADLLSKYFDDDMTRRASELKKVEQRLVKLRELLERRRAKKQEIIELQTKVALNEADGLGFYDGQPRNPWPTDFGWQPAAAQSIFGPVGEPIRSSGSVTVSSSGGSGASGRTITTTRVDSGPAASAPAADALDTESAETPR